jgi:hypothetical protein
MKGDGGDRQTEVDGEEPQENLGHHHGGCGHAKSAKQGAPTLPEGLMPQPEDQEQESHARHPMGEV